MLIDVNNIKIKKRIRIDNGNLDLLKDSLQKYGQFHPLLINEKHELISGFRRLESVKQLGWLEIEVKIVSSLNKLELIERELEENLVRKDFTDSELKDAYQRLKKLKQPNLFNRIITFFKSILVKKS